MELHCERSARPCRAEDLQDMSRERLRNMAALRGIPAGRDKGDTIRNLLASGRLRVKETVQVLG